MILGDVLLGIGFGLLAGCCLAWWENRRGA